MDKLIKKTTKTTIIKKKKTNTTHHHHSNNINTVGIHPLKVLFIHIFPEEAFMHCSSEKLVLYN